MILKNVWEPWGRMRRHLRGRMLRVPLLTDSLHYCLRRNLRPSGEWWLTWCRSATRPCNRNSPSNRTTNDCGLNSQPSQTNLDLGSQRRLRSVWPATWIASLETCRASAATHNLIPRLQLPSLSPHYLRVLSCTGYLETTCTSCSLVSRAFASRWYSTQVSMRASWQTFW